MDSSTSISPLPSPTTPPPPFLYRLFGAFFNIAVLGVLSIPLASFWWGFEVLSCFRVQYALLLGSGLLMALIQGRRGRAIFGLVLFLFNGVGLYPFLALESALPAVSARSLKVITINVHTANQRWDLVLDCIASKSPDIVFFTEVNEEWLTRLKPLEKDFPFFVSHPRDDNFGVALFSRIQPQRQEIINFLGSDAIPSVLLTMGSGSETVTLVGTHPLPPRNFEYTFCRNAQLKALGEFFANTPGHKILVGDLNTPPWADRLHELQKVGGLKDSALGRGIAVTWPSHAWWLLGIPIDHCLVSPEISVRQRTVGPNVGSDHYPVFVELGLPSPQ